MPTVTSITPSSGNTGGQNITVYGTGFSLEPKNNTVSIDGTPCKVTEASQGSLKCTLGPKDTTKSSLLSTNSTSQANGYFSGAGATYVRYSFSDSLSKFITAIRSNNSTYLGTPQ